MKTLNERATEILQTLLAVRAKKLKIKKCKPDNPCETD